MDRHRSLSLFVALVCGGMVASSGAFAIAACSSSSDDTGADGGDAGSDAPADARRFVDSSPEPDSSTKPTKAECRAKCKADHPNAIPKEDAIDKCWADSCTGPCVDQNTDFDAGEAGVDAAADGGGGDGGGVCGTSVPSGVSPACDRCTDALCCTVWRGCYNDTDCAAYDKCYGACVGP